MIPKPIRDRIAVTKYQAGASIADIMSAASIKCPNTLYKILNAHDVQMRRPRGTTTMDDLVGPISHLLFEEGMEPDEVAVELKQSLPFIMKVIEERL